MKLKRLIIALHRDMGYLFAGITIIYAVSGVAVNHVSDWNPSYAIERSTHATGALPPGSDPAPVVLERMGVTEKPRAAVRTGEDQMKIFLEGRTLIVRLSDGMVEDETVTRRPVLFHMNYLHLNHGKGAWTWAADIYAVGLLALALTGIFIIPGAKGLKGRGFWFMTAGILLPVVFLLWKT